MTTTARPELEGLDRYKFGWADPDTAGGDGLQITASRAPARQRHRRPDGPIPGATCPWELCERPGRLPQVYGKSSVRQRDSCRPFSERRAVGLTGENEHG
jgi:hypothetical protein